MKTPVHISKLHGKLHKIKAISTNTRTNSFCFKMSNSFNKKVICTKCYSWAILDRGIYPALEPALQRNSDLFSSRLLEDHEIPNIKDKVFRFNAHGELINLNHLKNYISITNKNPNCTFALWTKRKDLIKFYFNDNDKPNNLIIIYSNPIISTIKKEPPKYFDKTFNNVLEEEHKDKQNCTGQKCINCLLCYSHNNIHQIVEKVKRY
jgi:hypothetical protein